MKGKIIDPRTECGERTKGHFTLVNTHPPTHVKQTVKWRRSACIIIIIIDNNNNNNTKYLGCIHTRCDIDISKMSTITPHPVGVGTVLKAQWDSLSSTFPFRSTHIDTDTCTRRRPRHSLKPTCPKRYGWIKVSWTKRGRKKTGYTHWHQHLNWSMDTLRGHIETWTHRDKDTSRRGHIETWTHRHVDISLWYVDTWMSSFDYTSHFAFQEMLLADLHTSVSSAIRRQHVWGRGWQGSRIYPRHWQRQFHQQSS